MTRLTLFSIGKGRWWQGLLATAALLVIIPLSPQKRRHIYGLPVLPPLTLSHWLLRHDRLIESVLDREIASQLFLNLARVTEHNSGRVLRAFNACRRVVVDFDASVIA